MPILEKFKDTMQDPLFWRVTVCLIGFSFALLGAAGVIALMPSTGWWWLGVVLLGALAGYGGFLVYAACFGNDALFDRSTDFIHDGGDLLGAIFMIVTGLIAIPVTMLLRLVRPR